MAEQEIFRIEGDASDAIQALEQLASALEKLPAIVQKISKSISSMGTSVDKSLKKIETRIDSLNAKLETNQQKFKETGASITSISRRANTLNTKMETQGKIYSDVHKSVGSVNTASKQLNTSLSNVSKSMEKVGSSAQASTATASTGLKKVNTQAQAVASTLSAKPSTAGGASIGGTSVAGITKFSKSLSTLGTITTGVVAGFKVIGGAVQQAFKGAGSLIQGFGRGLMTIHNTTMTLVNSVRMLAQGITNAGRAMMFFVSLPLIGFMTKATTTAIDFEDALVRTGKTTNLWWGSGLDELKSGLRELAKYTSTTHTELAVMAEQVGQLGVRGVDNILNLVDLFNTMTITTDLSADSVAKSMGKIGNAFGYNLSSAGGVRNLTALATTINRLENETAASADEIVTSMLKWAQMANQMRISAAEAAGLSASMIALGMSEEESGTALKNASLYMAAKIDKLQSALRLQEKYNTVEKTRQQLDRDQVGVFLDLAEAAKEYGSNSEAMTTLIEIGNLRGGRALMAMATNVNFVRENLQRANSEWEHGNSLFEEYEKAMTSTKNQLGVLRNNISDVGITLGETLLPQINKLVSVLIPAVQEFNKWFESLDSKTKLLAVGIALLIIVIGPLLFFFGQIMHAVSLIAWGFGTLIGLVPKLIMGIGSLIMTIAGLGKFALLIPVGIVGGILLLMKFLGKTGADIAKVFTDIASKATQWGNNLARNFGQGFLAGAVKFIATAIATVARMIAGFFESHSPPKEGPLKGINKWGTALMETYLKGFELADFGILKDISGYIEKILTMGKEGMPLAESLGNLAKARVIISQVVDRFNKTGQIAYDLLDKMVKGTGKYGSKLKDLLVTQLQYKKVQQELANIENRRKEIDQEFRDSIKRISQAGDVGYKVSEIRKAKRARDDELRSLKMREEMLERQEEYLKEQVELQKAMLDALLDQEDIFQRIADIIKSLGESQGGGGDLGGVAFPDPDEMSDVRNAIDEAGRTFETFKERIGDAKEAFQGFLDGFSGTDMKSLEEFANIDWTTGTTAENIKELLDSKPLYEFYTQLYNIGQTAGEIKGKIATFASTVSVYWENLKTFFGGVSAFFTELSKPESPHMRNIGLRGEELSGGGASQLDNIQKFVDTVKKVIDIPVDLLKGIFEDILAYLTGFYKGMEGTDFIALSGAIKRFIDVLSVDSGEGSWAEAGGKLVKIISFIIGLTAGSSIRRAIGGFTMLVELITQFIGALKGQPADWTNLSKMWDAFWSLSPSEEQLVGFFSKGEDAGTFLADGFNAGVEENIQPFTPPMGGYDFTGAYSGGTGGVPATFWSDILIGDGGDLEKVGSSALSIVQEGLVSTEKPSVPIAETLFGEPKNAFEEWATSAIDGLFGFLAEPKDGVETSPFITAMFGDAENNASTVGQDIMTGIGTGISTSDAGTTAIKDASQQIIDMAKEKFGIKSPSEVFSAMGVDLMLGLEDGILSKVGSVFASASGAINTAIQGMTASGKGAMRQMGIALGSGFVEGIRTILLAIAGRAPSPFAEYLTQLANGLKISSPSKVAEEIGTYFGEGFVQGVAGVMDANAFAYDAASFYETNNGVMSPTIIIDNPIVSDSADIDLMVEKIKDALAHDVYKATKFGGYTNF